MTVSLRPVAKSDLMKIFEWRNAPEVRRMMFDASPLDAERHKDYWRKRLADKNDLSRIILADGKEVGVAKLDKKKEGYEVDIFIDPAMQGKGIGSGALKLLINESKTKGIRRVFAKVRPENEASRKMFLKDGFVLGYEYFERDIL